MISAHRTLPTELGTKHLLAALQRFESERLELESAGETHPLIQKTIDQFAALDPRDLKGID